MFVRALVSVCFVLALRRQYVQDICKVSVTLAACQYPTVQLPATFIHVAILYSKILQIGAGHFHGIDVLHELEQKFKFVTWTLGVVRV